MARTAFLAFVLALVLAFFSPGLQGPLREALRRRPRLIWLAPLVLSALFTVAEAIAGVVTLPITLAILAYTLAPVACAAALGPGPSEKPRALDFGIILVLWLPVEINAARSLVPRPAQGFLHSAVYGVAILLALTLLLCFRALDGMKYTLPRPRDLRLAVIGFVIAAPVLIGAGILIGFIPPPHLPVAAAGKMAAAAGLIFAATALPEEILFRALIQNLILQRWGASNRNLFFASLIFGCAHLNNGPQPLPNWRYMILATIAGFAYGKVFQKASSVTASALFHALVDWSKHFFF